MITLDFAEEWIHTEQALTVAASFASASILISTIHISQHLNNYTMPGIQIYVVRILFICPVYAMSSALALWLGPLGVYAETFRDVYEALVIYAFMNLVLEYCGGETDCIYQIENEPPLQLPWPLCCQHMPKDARLMRLCQRGVLQFILVKPVVAILDSIMLAAGLYYLTLYQYFVAVVYNISYTYALYCLYVFYLATSRLISEFRPVLKFASIKVIVFATYYQSLLVKASTLPIEETAMWNNLILCVEMVFFSFLLMLAFPISEFRGGIPENEFIDNARDIFRVGDMMQDLHRNFTPIYHDYGLQKSEKETVESLAGQGGGISLSEKLGSAAAEMSNRYRGRNRKFAFNALLRGDRPIKARLRPIRDDSPTNQSPSPGNSSDIEGVGLDGSLWNNSVNSSHGLLNEITSSSDRQIVTGINSYSNNQSSSNIGGSSDNTGEHNTNLPGNNNGSVDTTDSVSSKKRNEFSQLSCDPAPAISRDDSLRLRTHGIFIFLCF